MFSRRRGALKLPDLRGRFSRVLALEVAAFINLYQGVYLFFVQIRVVSSWGSHGQAERRADGRTRGPEIGDRLLHDRARARGYVCLRTRPGPPAGS